MMQFLNLHGGSDGTGTEPGNLVTVPSQVSDVKGGEPACRPGSVPPLARGGGHPSGTAVADSLVRSTREHRAGRPQSLAQGAAGSPLDLAPDGVYRAAAVTCGAGGLLHHRFTLTPAGAGAVCFLWHCPAGRPGSALPTTLPCGARTFLTGLAPGATARPTHPSSGYAEGHRCGVADRDRGDRAVLAASHRPGPDGERRANRQPARGDQLGRSRLRARHGRGRPPWSGSRPPPVSGASCGRPGVFPRHAEPP